MKKIIALIVSIMLIASFSVGCGKEKPAVGEGEFEGHKIGEAVYVTVVDKGLGREWMDALADAYYEETGITVEVSADPSLVTTVEQQMGSDYAETDDLYFVAQANSQWLDYINRGKIEAIDDVLSSAKYGVKAEDRSRDDMITQIGNYSDANYLLPYVYSNFGLIYNSEYLNQIEPLSGQTDYKKGEWPNTMKGLIELCAATKAAKITNSRTGRTVEPFSCGLTVNYMNQLFYALWDELDSQGLTNHLNQNDKSAFNSSYFNSKAVEDVFGYLFDLIGAKSNVESNLCANAEDHLTSQSNFVNGNCVFTFCGVWFETEMKEILKSTGMTSYHYGAYPVINSENQNRLYMNLPGEFFFIPSSAQNVWGAKDFLAFCVSEKGIAAAERVLNAPMAFTTEEEVEFTQFGREIEQVVENSKKLYIYSQNDVYKTGALSLYNLDSPFIKISKYQITNKAEIKSKLIEPEVTRIKTLWQDYMNHI